MSTTTPQLSTGSRPITEVKPCLACVAGGMRERASGGRAAIFLSGEAREEFASGEAASEFPACHIPYGFCLPPTFIAFDESIK